MEPLEPPLDPPLASIDLLHAYVLSYASANCRLAYMLLHRGICTFGALLCHAVVVAYLGLGGKQDGGYT